MSIPVPQHIEELEPYHPGKPIADVLRDYGIPEAIKLASNENPLGPSPLALREMERVMHGLAFYPNGGRTLRKLLSVHYGLDIEEVIVGSGSEGVLNNLMRTFLQPQDEVLTSAGTFSGFSVIARAMNLKVSFAPMRDFGYDLDALAAAITPATKLIYIANPNNPTGTYITRTAFEEFYERVPKHIMIVHDEAYYEYAIDDVPEYPTLISARRANVVALRTYSKAYGLAGVRIGFGTASSHVISRMLKVKLPFEPSELAQAAGIGALLDVDFLHRTLAVNREGKEYLREAYTNLGLDFIETAGNFFCLNLGSRETAQAFTQKLERRGIIVRHCLWFGLPTCVRITIGTMPQNYRATEAISEVLEEMQGALTTQH